MVTDAIEGRLNPHIVVQRLIDDAQPIDVDDLEVYYIYGLGSSLVEFRGAKEHSLEYMRAEEDSLENNDNPEREIPIIDAKFLELPCQQSLLENLYYSVSEFSPRED